jgi:predicted RNA binding protein YcfA (HicA-like mRNA interferase family)
MSNPWMASLLETELVEKQQNSEPCKVNEDESSKLGFPGAVSTNDLVRIYKKLGFVEEKSRGKGSHTILRDDKNRAVIIPLKTGGSREISACMLIGRYLKQSHLSKQEFLGAWCAI